MRKILLLMICFTSSVYANDWEQIFPVFDISGSQECKWFSFNQAYLTYRIIDESEDTQCMEIDLHDQVVRGGYWFDRSGMARFGTFIKRARVNVGAKMLLRMFSLASGITTQVNTCLHSWWLRPNFDLLESLLAEDKEAVVQAFIQRHPHVRKIKFVIENRYHFYEIGEVDYDDEIDEWITKFSAQGIEVEI